MREIVSQARPLGWPSPRPGRPRVRLRRQRQQPQPLGPGAGAPRNAGAITSAPQGQIWELAYQQRRGRMSIPQNPANIDSSPMIDTLNKALKALNATDRDYDGHREKAINHVETAIHKLQVPTANAKGKSNGADAKADAATLRQGRLRQRSRQDRDDPSGRIRRHHAQGEKGALRCAP